MLSTFAVVAALSLAPAQTGTLKIQNDRPTHGPLGHVRKSNQVLPGGIYWVTFAITGLKVREDGLIQYSMGLEVTDAEGKPQFKSDPQDLDVVDALGGGTLPAFAKAAIGTDTPPGQYTMKVTIKDRAANTSTTLSHQFEVLRPQFGLVRIGLTYETGQDAPPIAAAGQTLVLNFWVAHFTLDKKSGDADVDVEMRILDEAGKPTLSKPFTGKIDRVPERYRQAMPQQVRLELNRPGKFKVVIRATDNLADKKTVEHTMDLTVLEVK